MNDSESLSLPPWTSLLPLSCLLPECPSLSELLSGSVCMAVCVCVSVRVHCVYEHLPLTTRSSLCPNVYFCTPPSFLNFASLSSPSLISRPSFTSHSFPPTLSPFPSKPGILPSFLLILLSPHLVLALSPSLGQLVELTVTRRVKVVWRWSVVNGPRALATSTHPLSRHDPTASPLRPTAHPAYRTQVRDPAPPFSTSNPVLLILCPHLTRILQIWGHSRTGSIILQPGCLYRRL